MPSEKLTFSKLWKEFLFLRFWYVFFQKWLICNLVFQNELELDEKSIEWLLNKWRFVFVPGPASDQVSVAWVQPRCNWDLITPSYSETRPGATTANCRHGREKWDSLSPDKSRPNARPSKTSADNNIISDCAVSSNLNKQSHPDLQVANSTMPNKIRYLWFCSSIWLSCHNL